MLRRKEGYLLGEQSDWAAYISSSALMLDYLAGIASNGTSSLKKEAFERSI